MDDTLRLQHLHLLSHIQRIDGHLARHDATRAVRAGAERVRVAKAFDDIRSRTLRARDDTNDTLSGKRGALAVHDDVRPEVVLDGGVVVGDVDHRLKLDTLERIRKDLLNALHHQSTVAQSEVYAILHLLPVHTELLASTGQERQTQLRGDAGVPTFVQGSRQLIVEIAHLLSQVTRTRVDHDPKRILLILLQLDEVVTTSQRTHLVQDGVLATVHHLQLIQVISLRQVLLVLRLLVVVHTQRNTFADSPHDLLTEHIHRDVAHLPIGLHGAHSAADINAHRIRDDNILAGEHPTDRHTHTSVHVRHDGQVVEEERKGGQVLNLTHGRLLHIVGPNLNQTVINRFYNHRYQSFKFHFLLVAPHPTTRMEDSRCKVRMSLRNLSAYLKKFTLFFLKPVYFLLEQNHIIQYRVQLFVRHPLQFRAE